MTSMVERVARAMIANDSGPEGSVLFEIHLREFGDGYRSGARAAIAAMREPTEEIEDAIRRTDCWDPEEHTESYGHAWRYAIEAALEEKP